MNIENIKKTYWAQAQYGGIVTIIYSNEDKENYTLNSSNGKQIIGIHDMINNIGVGKPFMNLFPMSMISKPIIVRGYNSNKPFIPLEHYIGNCQEDYMYGQDFEYIETKNRTHTILRVSNNDKIYIDISPMSMPNHFVDRLKYWHFNVDNIPDDEFINAHESKVYDIIVETNSEQFEYIKNEKHEHRCIIKEGFAQYPNEDIGAVYCSECKDICKETKNKINN